ncbi:MAG: hypothetical protein K2M75_00640 [Clostridia bacterium]|nr:hypothetical protein [Clostridia bacterium]
MDLIIELVGAVLEVYVELFTSSAENKNISKGRRIFLKILFAVIALSLVAFLVVGIILLIGNPTNVEQIVGIVLIALAAIGMLAHIIIVLVNAKKNKKINEPLDKEDIQYKENDNSLLK